MRPIFDTEMNRKMNSILKDKLSTVYKIIAALKLDDLTYTHISARLPGSDSFFIGSFPFMFDEMEPDRLCEVSMSTGDIINDVAGPYNPTAYSIHQNVYQARPDVNAVLHLHSPHTLAVSSMEEGLLPISQHALHFYEQISYHDYDSLAVHHEIGAAMGKDLGTNNAMLLRNHGSLTVGKTLEEALFYMYHLERACHAQVLALSMGRPLHLPSAAVCRHTREELLNFETDLGARDFQALQRKVG